jgi:Ca-activated chloride channel family protein
MTAEDREARLTAYALGDPGLSPADRREVEAQIAADTAARRAVEETRRLAQLLTAGLAAEQAALPAEAAVTIPTPERAMRTHKSWAKAFVAAAAVVIAVGGTYVGVSEWRKARDPDHRSFAAAPAAGNAPGEADRGRETAEGRMLTPRGAASMASAEAQRRGEPVPAGAGGGAEAAPGEAFSPTMPPAPSSKKAAGRPGFGAAGGGLAPGGIPGPHAQPAGPGGPPARGGSVKDGAPAADLPPAPAVAAPPADSKPKPDPLPPGELPSKEEGAAGQIDRHPTFIENNFTRVEGLNALSTFGVDVDTASYSIVRKYLTSGQLPPANAVRLEEMVNYFPYADKPPAGDDPFAVTVEVADCPWEPTHQLARLGLKAKPIANDKRPPSNLVFLIDVSGSMDAPERLPLVKAGLKLLVSQLSENDRVAMVVYAGTTGLVLDSTPATQKDKIVNVLDRLEAGGSTNGSGGIQQAYEVAAAHFIKGGTNRVILCTDGDWNVGTTSTDALVKLIEEKRKTGVYLSAFGFGMGNVRDDMLVRLADHGNGNYAYIDTLKEAHKSFVEQIGGTLVTVAKDVKVQVEFNPAVIKSYRLLGYEKRILAAKDFHDDTKDAGEMGAGHVVTALYELVPVGAPDPVLGTGDKLRYQKDPTPREPLKPDEAFLVKMRHKKPDADTSTERRQVVKNKTVEYARASEDFQFAAAVASFAMLLKDSPYKGHSNYGLVLELAEAAKKHDPSGYRAEFVDLVKTAKALAGK